MNRISDKTTANESCRLRSPFWNWIIYRILPHRMNDKNGKSSGYIFSYRKKYSCESYTYVVMWNRKAFQSKNLFLVHFLISFIWDVEQSVHCHFQFIKWIRSEANRLEICKQHHRPFHFIQIMSTEMKLNYVNRKWNNPHKSNYHFVSSIFS